MRSLESQDFWSHHQSVGGPVVRPSGLWCENLPTLLSTWVRYSGDMNSVVWVHRTTLHLTIPHCLKYSNVGVKVLVKLLYTGSKIICCCWKKLDWVIDEANLKCIENWFLFALLISTQICAYNIFIYLYRIRFYHSWRSPVFVLQDSSSRALRSEGSTSLTPWLLRFLITALAVSSAASRTYCSRGGKSQVAKNKTTGPLIWIYELPLVILCRSTRNAAQENFAVMIIQARI